MWTHYQDWKIPRETFMKIYKRSEFLKLPPGTFFARGEKWCIDGFYMKGESWENDFCFLSISDIDSFNSDEHIKRLEEMEETGKSYPMNECHGRDGLFDENELFLVFEHDDLCKIRKLIDYSMEN